MNLESKEMSAITPKPTGYLDLPRAILGDPTEGRVVLPPVTVASADATVERHRLIEEHQDQEQKDQEQEEQEKPCSTSPHGGNQVDGLPPVQNDGCHR